MLFRSDQDADALNEQWTRRFPDVRLDTVSDEYRNLTDKILEEINKLDDESSDDIVTVVIPEFVTSLRSQWLHNQSALAIKARLLFRPNTVVTSIPIVIPAGAEAQTHA